MEFFQQAIQGVVEVLPMRLGDSRGYFAETFKRSAFEAAGVPAEFVQENQAHSERTGTVRGLHFQVEPMAQAKLVSVVAGSVFDVAVDIRRDSPTFGRHVSMVLSAERGNQLFVPVGFAHGYCTLEADTIIQYKVSKPYARECDREIFWGDPALGINWPCRPEDTTLSARDLAAPTLAEATDLF
ncbi:dTDP-4-dehydrorhamnose 3,5-epimerase [Mesorhizobium sp. LHD-90]|uniref:dTDP-4-dehydrorhamnose 3,5-epimerase n=1 Tax=Mesorhizobium sp. LHD-90 TaxID=3071414 RepID=UPI0027E1DFE6|nr:dTDP-4-dehydrorhamnose 3,5-epimerase [Mesorhizobium sp. LHD-90]MDQ6437390.1 dTDP-4-dehydrorhamnose 3,5-epimerase [Mesorhizobium sp. LHD-90]